MTRIIQEAAGGAGTLTGARSMITLITPGWGSSGYYSPEVLAKAAEDKVFPAGTQMHIDHSKEDGVGSVATLAAVLEEDARWEPNWVDPKTGKKGRLAAENRVFSDFQSRLVDLKDHIGVSIASAAEMSLGEAEGQQGRIIEALLPSPLNRVDYVSVAGRGGHISEVLESATPEKLAKEATANDTREWLSKALREAYAGDGVWVWLRDYDETNVWFEREDANGMGIFQESYLLENNAVTLSGQAVEVRIQTSYVPVSANPAESADSPPDPAGVTEGKEPVMGTIQIEESAHAALVEKSGRVTALEADVTAAKERAGAAESALTEANDTAAEALVTAALEAAGVSAPKLAARLAKGYPVKENGVLDAEALRSDVAESVAELQVGNGAGTPRGVGHTQESVEPSAEAITPEKAQESILAFSGYTPKGAK